MTDLRNYKPLRMIAADAEDLSVVSACLQDAVAKLGDFAWLPEQRRFAFVANRFCWEAGGDKRAGPFWRARVGVHFNDVTSVRQQNLRPDVRDAIVEILALRFEGGDDGAGAVFIDLAGGGAIRLEVDAVNAELTDIMGPWRTRSKPEHDDA